MVERPIHYRVPAPGPAGEEPFWEVFIQNGSEEGLRHIGTIAAASERVAYERARRLFGWYAEELWLVKTTSIYRYTTDQTVEGAIVIDPPDANEPRSYED